MIRLCRLMACTMVFLLLPTTAAALELALISDLNGRYGSTDYNKRVGVAVQEIIDRDVDLVIIAGDMVAGQRSDLTQENLEAMWAAFHAVVSEPLAAAGIPLIITPGNHDGSSMRGFEAERDEFRRQWRERNPDLQLLDGSDWPDRYAMLQDGLLLISIDGTRPGRLPAEELNFLSDMLQRHGRTAEATLVFGHLPMWPLARGRERDVISDPQLLGLLQASRVTAYASGHHHLFFAGVDDRGLLHLSVGSLGGNTRAFADGPGRQPFSMTLLRFEGEAMFVEALAAPDFDTVLPPTAMPETVEGPLGVLRQSDQVQLRR